MNTLASAKIVDNRLCSRRATFGRYSNQTHASDAPGVDGRIHTLSAQQGWIRGSALLQSRAEAFSLERARVRFAARVLITAHGKWRSSESMSAVEPSLPKCALAPRIRLRLYVYDATPKPASFPGVASRRMRSSGKPATSQRRTPTTVKYYRNAQSGSPDSATRLHPAAHKTHLPTRGQFPEPGRHEHRTNNKAIGGIVMNNGNYFYCLLARLPAPPTGCEAIFASSGTVVLYPTP